MDKKSFILYIDYRKHFSRLSDEEAGQLIKAVFDYAAGSEAEPILSPAADMAFSFIKDRIDIDAEKFKQTCRKRSEAGKKGMASRWNNKAKQKITKITDNDNENENDIDNDNDNGNDNDTEPCEIPAPQPNAPR